MFTDREGGGGGGGGGTRGQKKTLPKICHTYPTMIKLGIVIFYLKNISPRNIEIM